MKLRLSYQDERGGIDFGEVEIIVDFAGAKYIRRAGDAPLQVARTVELEAEGGGRGEIGPWWSALTIEVLE